MMMLMVTVVDDGSGDCHNDGILNGGNGNEDGVKWLGSGYDVLIVGG